MTCTKDHLGRVWSHIKLDQLLRYPEVAAAIEDMDRAGRRRDGVFRLSRAEAWATKQGRSEAGFALLLMLWWRRLEMRLGRAA